MLMLENGVQGANMVHGWFAGRNAAPYHRLQTGGPDQNMVTACYYGSKLYTLKLFGLPLVILVFGLLWLPLFKLQLGYDHTSFQTASSIWAAHCRNRNPKESLWDLERVIVRAFG